MLMLRNELRELPPPEALLFDLDGTLYRGNEPIQGAGEMITELNERGMPCLFVTNNSTRTPLEVAQHLHLFGIPAAEAAIVTSALAAAYYIQKNYPGARAYVIGEKGLKEALMDKGIHLLGDEEKEQLADIVVQGLDRKLNYDKMTVAVKHLLQGAIFIQSNPDRLLPIDGGFIPGAGSIGASLQAAAQIEPIVIGKPSPIMIEYALELAGTSADRAWIIGDNPYTDIAAGQHTGCPSILMLTGLCTADNWQEHCRSAGVQPHAVVHSPTELIQLFHELHTKG